MKYTLNLRKDEFNIIDHINLKEQLEKDLKEYLKKGNKISEIKGCELKPKPARTISKSERDKSINSYKYTKHKNNIAIKNWCRRAVGRKLYLSEKMGGKMYLLEGIIRGRDYVGQELMVNIEIMMQKIELFEKGLIN